MAFQWPKDAADRLSNAGQILLEQRREFLESLLIESRERLSPLGEPLELDLGVHRRLKSEREEAYSDWLAWVLSHLTSGEIADLFFIPADLITDRKSPALKIIPEYTVNHEGKSGRIDVLVKFPGNTALVLERKKGSIDGADTEKQEKIYFPAMQKIGMNCHYVLLVTDNDKAGQERHKFTVIDYATLCRKLRCWAVEAIKSKKPLILVAMALAFVGAIEANLLLSLIHI